MKAVEIHLAAGQESLQEIDPALLEVLRDRGFGLGWEPVLVHASRLSPDARTGIRAGPARGPGAHLQFAIARTRSHYDPRNCYRSPCPTARVSAELPLALLEETDQAGGNVSRGRDLQMVINAAMTAEPRRSSEWCSSATTIRPPVAQAATVRVPPGPCHKRPIWAACATRSRRLSATPTRRYGRHARPEARSTLLTMRITAMRPVARARPRTPSPPTADARGQAPAD